MRNILKFAAFRKGNITTASSCKEALKFITFLPSNTLCTSELYFQYEQYLRVHLERRTKAWSVVSNYKRLIYSCWKTCPDNIPFKYLISSTSDHGRWDSTGKDYICTTNYLEHPLFVGLQRARAGALTTLTKNLQFTSCLFKWNPLLVLSHRQTTKHLWISYSFSVPYQSHKFPNAAFWLPMDFHLKIKIDDNYWV